MAPLVFQSILLLPGDIPVNIGLNSSGPASGLCFTVASGRDNQPRTLSVYALGPFSAGTVALWASADGGVTWNLYQTYSSVNIASDSIAVIPGLMPSYLYRLDLATLTGGPVQLKGSVA